MLSSLDESYAADKERERIDKLKREGIDPEDVKNDDEE